MWNLPGPGIKPVSSALAGGSSTTGPSGESIESLLLIFPLCFNSRWLLVCALRPALPSPRHSLFPTSLPCSGMNSSLLLTQGASLVTQMAENLLAMQETQVWSLGQEDPLKKGMATHSSILAWRIPWTEEPDGLRSTVSQSDRLKQLGIHACTAYQASSGSGSSMTWSRLTYYGVRNRERTSHWGLHDSNSVTNKSIQALGA